MISPIPFIFSESAKIDAVVDEWVKAGRKPLVYKKVDYIVSTTTHRLLPGLDVASSALSKFGHEFPVKIWLSKIVTVDDMGVSSYRYILFYDETEDGVLARFTGLVPKKSVDTPKSVLVKMVSKRILNIYTIMSLYNSNTYRTKQMPNIEFNSIAAIDRAITIIEAKINRGNTLKLKEDFEKLKSKKLFDDSIVKAAWDLIIVGEIHRK